MRSFKKILVAACTVFLISGSPAFYAQTGNITLNFKNIDSTSAPLPGANGRVILYDSNYNTISTLSTDSLGIVKFANQSYGTYYFEGYHNPNPTTIFGSEYWGSTTVNHNSPETSVNLIRYMPYFFECKVFINSSNVEVTGSTVAPGSQLRLEVTILNPGNSSKTVKGRMVLDRNQTSSYDFDQMLAGSSITGNGTIKFLYSFTPTIAGSYYGASGVLTNVNNNYIITDGTNWFANPLFTIVPLPPALSSPSNSAVEVSTTPTLKWAASTGAVSYQVQISTNSSFSNLIFDQSGITATSLNVAPDLPDGTTFYWRVNASNSGGSSNWSTTRSFTTTINEARITTIDFAGLKWNVSSGFSGPGPNNWFNGINSVWIDNSGNLHLAIRKIGDKWYCSGITAQDTMGYGEYSFSVSSNVELYDPNIIVGLFVYENDSKEIDIEFSRWGDAGSNAGWFVVQPPSASSSTSFSLNLQNYSSTHKFTWKKESIKFQSYHVLNELIKEWTYQGSKNPLPNQMKPHINFWLMSGSSPVNQNNAELVISNFKYTPVQLLTSRSNNVVVPTEFKLSQNYPNPFNPATKIEFSIPKETFVKLSIYNAIGQETAILVNKELQASTYSIDFDGSALPNGIYFYTLQAGKFTQTKKMILLK